MPIADQLSFNLSDNLTSKTYGEHDFVIMDEHQDAYDLLTRFFAQDDYGSSILNSLILIGDSSCGKTHLLNIFANKYGCKIYSCDEIANHDISDLFLDVKFLIIDDVDELSDDNLLFHIYNLALESGVFLLFSLKNINVFQLRDLVSRLRNIVRAEIKNPDVDMVKILLSKGFSQRQLKIDGKIIDFLAANVARKYCEVEEMVKKVEKFCFENKKTISLGDVKKMV